MRSDRERFENEDHGEQWNSFTSQPSQMWSQRKCNIYLHLAAAIMCLFTETPKCNIPLKYWLSGQFIFLLLESASMELKDRMQ